MKSALPLLLVGIGVLLVAGCASTPAQAPYVPTGDPVIDSQEIIRRAPPRDRVLVEYQIAADAMRRGQYDLAKRYLDDAITSIEGIFAGADKKTLYIVGRGAAFKVRLLAAGYAGRAK